MSQTATAEHDWPTARFRHLADVRKGILPLFRIEAHPELEVLPYLTMEYLRGDGSDPNLVPVDPSLLVAPADSILLLWDGANAGEFLRAKRGVVSSTSALVVPRDVDRDFLYWACKSQEDQIRAATIGMGIPHVNGDSLANVAICLPPPSQQRAIADYLDRETARLDTLLAAKARMLELLAERRRALIATAVSRGIGSTEHPEPTAFGALREKESQYQTGTRREKHHVSVAEGGWMSQTSTAEHDWPTARFRHLADVRKGILPLFRIEAHPELEVLPYLTMEYLRGDGSDPNLVPVDPSLLVAPADSILLLWDGANAGEFLRAKRGVVSSTSALVVPRDVDRDFLYWACKSQEDRIRAATIGMGIPHVNGDSLANMTICLPPPPQQRAIADYLDRETARLDELAAKTRRTIALLKERRAALIAAAVTGRIDVESAA